MDEILEVVDEQNGVIGTEKRSVIIRDKLMHRAVTLFIVNGKGQIMVGKRSKEKEESPDRYSFPVSGHLKQGESPDETMKREVKEELGLEQDLEFLTVFRAKKVKDNHFCYLFLMKLERPIQSLDVDDKESSKLFFWTKDETKERIKERDDFSPNFIEGFEWLIENGKI